MKATAPLNNAQVKSDNPQTAATHTCTLDCVQQYMKLLLSFAYITTHARIVAVYTISTTYLYFSMKNTRVVFSIIQLFTHTHAHMHTHADAHGHTHV